MSGGHRRERRQWEYALERDAVQCMKHDVIYYVIKIEKMRVLIDNNMAICATGAQLDLHNFTLFHST